MGKSKKLGFTNKSDTWVSRLSTPFARAFIMDDGVNLFQGDTQKWIKRVSYYNRVNCFFKIRRNEWMFAFFAFMREMSYAFLYSEKYHIP